MKKFLAFATTIAMLLSLAVLGSSASSEVWDGTVATSFESGSGTEADPYLIKNGAQLAYLAQQVATKADTYAGKYIVLGSNIDLAKLEWTPIGVFKSKNSESNVAFEGSFDGRGYTISGISITNEEASIYNALFGYVDTDGYFKNLVIADSEITSNAEGNGYAGSAAALIVAAEISSIIVKDDVTVASTDSIGGVFGRIEGGNAKYLVNYATVSTSSNVDSTSWAGGICGALGNDATISYSANHGKVSANAFCNGGIVGLVGSANGGGNIINCYNDGEVEYTGTGNGFAAGIVGRLGFKDGNYAVKDTYNLGEVSKPNDGGNSYKRIGEITGQTYKGEIILENVYSIDVQDVESIYANSTNSDLTTVESKIEIEIKIFADTIDSEINANIIVPSAEPEVTEPEVTEPEVTEPEVTEPETTEPIDPVPTGDLALAYVIISILSVAAVAAVAKKRAN